MLQITLYSTHCPKCNVLEKKLMQKNIVYDEVNDIEVMKKKGYLTLPVLEIDGVGMEFKAAVEWVNSPETGKE